MFDVCGGEVADGSSFGVEGICGGSSENGLLDWLLLDPDDYV